MPADVSEQPPRLSSPLEASPTPKTLTLLRPLPPAAARWVSPSFFLHQANRGAPEHRRSRPPWPASSAGVFFVNGSPACTTTSSTRTTSSSDASTPSNWSTSSSSADRRHRSNSPPTDVLRPFPLRQHHQVSCCAKNPNLSPSISSSEHDLRERHRRPALGLVAGVVPIVARSRVWRR